MRRRVAVLAACLAAALVVAGCGAGGRDRNADARYVQEVNAAQTEFARRFDRLSARIGSTITPAQGRSTLRAFESAVDGTVARLRGVDPPKRVTDLHGRLVGQISSYGNQIATARKAFASDDPRRVLAAQGKLSSDVQRTSAQINRTIDQINTRLKG